MKVLDFETQVSSSKSTRIFAVMIASLLLVLLMPLYAVNVVIAVLFFCAPIKKRSWMDISGCRVELYQWSKGIFADSAALFNVIKGDIEFVGNPLVRDNVSIPKVDNFRSPCSKSGLFDYLQLHSLTGLKAEDPQALLNKQVQQSVLADLVMVFKILICRLLYSGKTLDHTSRPVFGLSFSNCQMEEAVSWVLDSTASQTCRTAFFINANSINLAAENSALRSALKSSNRNFIDGSGMRLAVRKVGVQLADNCNGTDMLPQLCERMEASGKSVFLLGAKPGVAEKAAQSLRQTYPNLRIAGSHHGYFDDDEAVIAQINQSKADIVLVALGSPRQEIWLDSNKHKLEACCALAVGGLFDFFSGDVPRAPLWLRELGLEWVWRLIQQPKAKFHRYVIGNPIFLFRVYILNQALRGL
ncbi:WecB/TagA/CpsF family glycosyltransferase [Pseudoalteromonas sp. SCSIO 43201]|uniref:WecB/TagA/CpsF family glycosyltransferase n=1 Tax=Pseudoalteromonas sp. SCSIO 43201 TaxID=2822842 RepID=UPI002074DC19|nr:WecB/TagA/CpsF family glycosyltransferase [Pseudoalteromonas sp. SCSIO 43201]USD29186.1 WecB/TagA/CpsF family glycosyltransferase [Pseudoalteromonas sp. SCSIO 43201]